MALRSFEYFLVEKELFDRQHLFELTWTYQRVSDFHCFSLFEFYVSLLYLIRHQID